MKLFAETLNPKNIKIAQREALMWGTSAGIVEYGSKCMKFYL
jgi:hypothetical protein